MALNAFNGQLVFQTAFGYNVADIHAFLNNVVNNPANYRERDPANPAQPYPDPNPQQDVARRLQNLTLLRDAIIGLTPPNGASYVAPAPAQSILRAGNQLAPTVNIQWPVTNPAERFYLIFDLLGVFFSIISPAPTRGTAPTVQNFFFPLVAVYARWCRTLVGGGAGLVPTVAQVTRARQDNNHPWFFFLGTSAKGWSPNERAWRLRAQQTRHQYMFRLLEAQYQVWNVSPEITVRGRPAGWNFGNCGETYPFLYFLSTGMPAGNLRGIATDIANTNLYGTNWAQYPFKPPCRNCSHLIQRHGAQRVNFTANQPP